MRRNAIIVGILLSALSWVGLATAQSQSVEPVPYVYRIDIKGCTFEPVNRRQTGFRVQGLVGIVTALHGVADCKTISAVTDSGQELYTDLAIQQVDIARDIALLGSPELDALPAEGLVASSLSTAEILTSTLRVVGYPLGLDKQDTDVIENIRGFESLDDVIPDAEESADFIKRKSPSLTIDVLNLQAQLLPGHSGAPVIDPNDQLIAVGNGGLRGGTVGRSWAIPWQDVALRAVGDVKSQLDALAAKDLAALAFSSTYPGQVNTTTASATYTVQIIDSRQNQPIANAEVLLTHSAGYEIGVTDSKGFHTFHLSTDDTIDYGQSQLQVEAAGYESYSRDLPNVLVRVSPEKLRLTALSPTATVPATSTPTVASSQLCSFAFVVLDAESDKPVAKATIALFVGAKQDTGATDSTGFYLAKLPCSNEQDVEAKVRVSANDYMVYSRSVFLSNETTEILLERKATPTPVATSIPTSTLNFTVTTVSVIAATLEPTMNVRLRLLIPLYSYPNWWEPANYFWDEIASVNRQIPITAIINPNIGPDGGPPNDDYLRGLNDLRDAGVTLLGYVHTSYGSRLNTDLHTEIDLYDQYYDIDGIFFDEVSNSGEQIKYYQSLYQYVHSKNNLHIVVLNPGTTTDELYVSQLAGDVIVLFEDTSSALRNYNPDAYVSNYPFTRFAMLAYAVPDATILQTQLEFAIAHNIGYVYLTDDVLPNPWDEIPSFWDSETTLIQQLNAVTRMPTSTSTPQPAAIPMPTPTLPSEPPCEAEVRSPRGISPLSISFRNIPNGTSSVTEEFQSGDRIIIQAVSADGRWYKIAELNGRVLGWASPEFFPDCIQTSQ